eukprot:scaffold3581_cov417-Prasinococcus_capsulatus_cf.AAC.14
MAASLPGLRDRSSQDQACPPGSMSRPHSPIRPLKLAVLSTTGEQKGQQDVHAYSDCGRRHAGLCLGWHALWR